MNSNKWDRRYLDLAQHVSTWSRDPSTKCGAVITKNNRVVSIGFNGIPTGLDDEKYLHPRETKIACVLHSEVNAILTSNVPLADSTLYVNGAPCSNCAATMIQVGIKRVVMPPVDFEFAKRWNWHLSEQMFNDASVEITILEDENEQKDLS
ncbi:MAG TPA: deaminase [Methanosarcina sp.]|nr:deaminase [Methanosarcina sp.]